MASKMATEIPIYTSSTPVQKTSANSRRRLAVAGLASLATISVLSLSRSAGGISSPSNIVPINSQQILAECAALHLVPSPNGPPGFAERQVSDRFVKGTRPTLITNATVWTGNDGGHEIIQGGSVLIDKGIIKHVGEGVPDASYGHNVLRVNAQGAWVSPAINDLHSHLGVDSLPELRGSQDTNSVQGITQPWLRSLDGIDTHDNAYEHSISGGVATALVLPGSANAIGGQAFVIKLRNAPGGGPLAKVLEPPYSLLNGTHVDPSLPPRWRHMKHAAGENPSRVYGGTRMDTIWKFRAAYNEARKIKIAQDDYCLKAQAGEWKGLAPHIPESLQWEALVDVLRGKVKVNIHIYETVDFTGIVGLSNEFEFPIAAFHHAHEAYLVPDVIKKVWGGVAPGIAIFATNARYKRESFRGSEYAAKILHDNGLRVVMKSDHPVLNSRFLLHEAAQAHYYGLEAGAALRAVTSTPAELSGFAHRIGYIRKGHDGDIVLWDSHPLALGATPQQVWIDGIPQLEKPFALTKPTSLQVAPKTPSRDEEAEAAVKYDGLPPLTVSPSNKLSSRVVFTGVSKVWRKDPTTGAISAIYNAASKGGKLGNVVIEGGKIVSTGSKLPVSVNKDDRFVDLKGGEIVPGLTTYGSGIGLVDISPEKSTNDGVIYDSVFGKTPSLLKDVEIKAVDGLLFESRHALIAYRSGVTSAITAPTSYGIFGGLSTAFSTGASHKLEKGAVHQDVTALHVSIGHAGSQPSISTQIAALRKALAGGLHGDKGEWFTKAAKGEVPLVVEVVKADHIASLLELKAEVDARTGKKLRLVLVGAAEAHILAKELGEAEVGVILIPARAFPTAWDAQRALVGPPLTPESSIPVLLRNNVTLGLGVVEEWETRNVRFDLAWAALEANGTISKEEALALGSTNIEKLLGVESPSSELVAYAGGDFAGYESQPVAVISKERQVVDLF